MMLRRWFFRPAAVALFFYGAIVAGLFFVQGNLLFPVPVRMAIVAPDFESVIIRSHEGRRLQALYRAAEEPRGTIIFYHGNASLAADEQARGRVIAERGFNVLLAEYSGYGGSDGQPTGVNLMQDALASYDWAAVNADGVVIVYGASLGTGLAVHVAARRAAAAVILEAPYDALVEVAQRVYPWVPVRLLFRNNIAPVAEIGSLEMPVLIMHGDRDATIPLAHGRALAAAGGSNVRFEVIEGAGHNDLVRAGSLVRALDFLDTL